ncbi:MAG: hypothetical protein Q9160_006234 [Pyrenula sp. 1 TL-2023]
MASTSDHPPTYEESQASSHLRPPKPRNGIPANHRRSMEDEARELPPGWVRQWDAKASHQFFVDTKANPPRSIWHHPYDDETYLSTLSMEERERISALTPSKADAGGNTTDEEGGHHAQSFSSPTTPVAATSEVHGQDKKGGFGRKMKDKLTGTTHEQREVQRRQRAEQERRAYEMHLQLRQAMTRAIHTGEPQFVCKDQEGRDVYIEPPGGPGGVYGGRGYGYNPYVQGPYASPNVRFIRPAGPYGRPGGLGYGGGIGLPLMGGLLGGALIGGALGGF